MANFHDGYLDRMADFGRLSSLVQLVADNQAVSLAPGQGLLRLTSDNTTATNRTFTIQDGSSVGQELIIILESAGSTTCELLTAGNVKLVATWLPTQWNAIRLVWNGTFWIESNRDSGADSQGAAVANLSSYSTLTLDAPTAAVLSVVAPTAAAQGGTYDQSALNTALDLKSDQAKVATMVTALNTKLDLKSDQADVDTMITSLNTQLSAVYTKLNALLTGLRNAGIIAP